MHAWADHCLDGAKAAHHGAFIRADDVEPRRQMRSEQKEKNAEYPVAITGARSRIGSVRRNLSGLCCFSPVAQALTMREHHRTTPSIFLFRSRPAPVEISLFGAGDGPTSSGCLSNWSIRNRLVSGGRKSVVLSSRNFS